MQEEWHVRDRLPHFFRDRSRHRARAVRRRRLRVKPLVKCVETRSKDFIMRTPTQIFCLNRQNTASCLMLLVWKGETDATHRPPWQLPRVGLSDLLQLAGVLDILW